MSKLEKKTELGIIGEKIVRNFMTSTGFTITDSIDVYDSDKDFEAVKGDKKYTVEVKTQVPFVTKEAFTIKENQYRKCFSVDLLIFVCVPPNKPFKYAGQIFAMNPKKAKTEKYTTKDGRDMILIPIGQPAFKLIKKLEENEISLLLKSKSTNY